MVPTRSSRLQRRVKQIAYVKGMRSVRPLPGEVERDILSKIRVKWGNVPLNPHEADGIALPNTVLTRTFSNRKGELYAVCRNTLLDRDGFFIRVFRVGSHYSCEKKVATAHIEKTMDGVSISSLSKNEEVPSSESRHGSRLRPRGLDVARPIIEEAIAFAKEKGKHAVYLTTKGKKRMEHYQKFGFRVVEVTSDAVKMLLIL